MFKKIFYLIGTLVKRNSDKHISSGRCPTKRQSGQEALEEMANSEKHVLLMYELYLLKQEDKSKQAMCC